MPSWDIVMFMTNNSFLKDTTSAYLMTFYVENVDFVENFLKIILCIEMKYFRVFIRYSFVTTRQYNHINKKRQLEKQVLWASTKIC